MYIGDKMKENIILVGLSTCGKTTLGKEVSKSLKMNFVDCDNVIEHKEGKSISEIFKVLGENYFRQLEKELISSLFQLESTVISTGGGMPIYNNNMELLKKIGVVVFLNTPIDTLISRNLKVNNRPLIIENTEEKIKSMYNHRVDIYRKAHYTLDTCDLTIEQSVDAIINLVKTHMNLLYIK